MLDNPNWYKPKTKVKPKIMSIEGLIAWLRTQPADGKYEWNDPCKCLVHNYLKGVRAKFDPYETSYEGVFDGSTLNYMQVGMCIPHTYGAALERALWITGEKP